MKLLKCLPAHATDAPEELPTLRFMKILDEQEQLKQDQPATSSD